MYMCCSKFLAALSPRLLLLILVLICAGILGAGYILKNFYGIQPCQMCLYEQDVFKTAGVISLLGSLICSPTWQRRILCVLGLIFLGGALLAAYHVAIQHHWVSLPSFCNTQDFSNADSVEALREQMLNTPFVRCDQVTWSLFGLSLAAYNTLISLILALLCWRWVCVNKTSSSCK